MYPNSASDKCEESLVYRVSQKEKNVGLTQGYVEILPTFLSINEVGKLLKENHGGVHFIWKLVGTYLSLTLRVNDIELNYVSLVLISQIHLFRKYFR